MYDLVVIGGGINGAGIARDAAGRGLRVLLCEKDDLAAHTSSSSTKLIHGGLRYLEHYDFALVRKALIEREVLLKAAPHIIWPMRFVLPYQSGLRPAWMIRLGLFLYDHLGGRKILPPTKVLSRRSSDKLGPLKPHLVKAFEYSDCWVEDARLVVLNAVDAKAKGATILTRTECTSLEADGGTWSVGLRGEQGADQTVQARAVVNAAGPWVETVAGHAVGRSNTAHVRLVKGSHLITQKLFEGDHAYFFQNGDGRIMFAIPYENGTLTLIGTTDLPYDGDPGEVHISDSEIDYLCDGASEYFDTPITPDKIVSTYAGVRPLYDDLSADASSVTRDYVLSRDTIADAPMISVYGGKITTYRKLAEGVLDLLGQDLEINASAWTEAAPLPGGDVPGADFERFFKDVRKRYDWMDPSLVHRLARAYGSRIGEVVNGAETAEQLGHHYGAGLYQAEVDYLVRTEFA
ncbi:MAG: glycerol-3-phosphate dehydrogenase, partial [Pseudomonadota bacterium]